MTSSTTVSEGLITVQFSLRNNRSSVTLDIYQFEVLQGIGAAFHALQQLGTTDSIEVMPTRYMSIVDKSHFLKAFTLNEEQGWILLNDLSEPIEDKITRINKAGPEINGFDLYNCIILRTPAVMILATRLLPITQSSIQGMQTVFNTVAGTPPIVAASIEGQLTTVKFNPE